MLAGLSAAAAAFSPDSISGLLAWLKADGNVYTSGTTQATDGQDVSTWDDAHTSNNDFTQSTGGLKPLFKTNIINGKPVIRFDGSDDRLIHSGVSTGGTSFSLFLVLYNNSQAANYGSLISEGSTRGLFLRGSGAGGPSNKLDMFYSADKHNTTALTPGVWFYVSAIVSAGALTFYRNGTADGTSSSIISTSFNTIGDDPAGERFKGDIAEILIFNSAISGANLTNMHTYLASKYAL